MEGIASSRPHRLMAALCAICLVGGPLAGLLVRLFAPVSSTTASVAHLVADAAAHPGATHATLIADGFVWMMVPAVLAAIGLAWRGAPAMALSALVLSLPGWIAIVMLAAQDALIARAGDPAYGRGQAVALTTGWSNSGLVNAYTGVFVLGHLVGTVLLGVALWRARAIPRWAAALVAVSMPLHLVAFLAGVKVLDVFAWSLLLIGFAACARQVLAGHGLPSGLRDQRVAGPAVA